MASELERQRRIEERILTEEEFDVEGELEGDDISVMVRALARTTTLKVLDLRGIYSIDIGDNGVKLIVDALLSNPNCTVVTLDLGDSNLICLEGVKYLADSISHSNCTLQTLNLRDNGIGPEGVKYLADSISQSDCTLLTLDLGENLIGLEGVKHLADAISHSDCTLQTLDLRHNLFGLEGVKHLADSISHSDCTLQTLNLGHNSFGDEGARHLAVSISHSNCALETLKLDNCGIRDAGAEALADVMRYDNHTLKKITLGQNLRISRSLIEKIGRLVEINAESIGCSAAEVGKKKRAEYGPTVDEVYRFVRFNPHLLSSAD